MSINSIALRRCNAILPLDNEGVTDEIIGTLLSNLSSLGYTLGAHAIEYVRDTYSESDCVGIVNDIRSMLGATVSYRPMYPNFPKEVMDASRAKLFINAMLHYLGRDFGITVLPRTKVKEREELQWDGDIKIIQLISKKDLTKTLKTVVSQVNAYKPQDTEDILYMFDNTTYGMTLIPEDFVNRENMATIAGIAYSHNISMSTAVKSATDVLRIATSLSDGDVSLADNTRFRRFKRAERRALLHDLNGCKNIAEDMLRYRGRWLRLGERLHPSEPRMKQYHNAEQAFDAIRNLPKSIHTWYSRLEHNIAAGHLAEAEAMLAKRPGEYARRLNQLLERGSETAVPHFLSEAATKVPTKLLLEVAEYFAYRDQRSEYRIFFPKGNVAKAHTRIDERKVLDDNTVLRLVDGIYLTLISRFSTRKQLGKVYIDPMLESLTIPTASRSASKSLHTLNRGSKISLSDDTNFIRFFLYWKGSHVDIDMSCMFFDSEWESMDQVSYTNLKNEYATHSGDITSAPNGAAEFLDIDISKFLAKGGRYVLSQVYSYSNQPFNELEECWAGWMERTEQFGGEVYEPKTVKQKFDLASNSRVSIPVIIDLAKRRIIWLDLAMASNVDTGGLNSVEGKGTGAAAIGLGMLQRRIPTMHRLLTLHATGRGILTENREEADTVFDLQNCEVEDFLD